MRKGIIFLLVGTIVCVSQASWYWPFGSDEEVKDKRQLRISELMEPVTDIIDEATDLASEGKSNEAVEKYRKALDELARIEMENPERAQSAEFATLRNKRAYVNAAIDSLLLGQVRENAKAVAVSDTTELEKKLAAEREAKKKKESGAAAGQPEQKYGSTTGQTGSESGAGTPNRGSDPQVASKQSAAKKTVKPKASRKKTGRKGQERREAGNANPTTPRERAMAAIASGDYATAEKIIDELLRVKPNGAAALNLRAAMEAKRGNFKAAEDALDRAIMSNPRNHFAYYNMAWLVLQRSPDEGKAAARRYYETGRAMGGPQDAQLEAALK